MTTNGKRLGLVTALLFAVSACGGAQSPGGELAQSSSDLSSDNGLTTNGLTTNGLTTNGLTTNGLALGGLTGGALNAVNFALWFAKDPSYSSMVMKYLVRYAMPAGKSLTYLSGLGLFSWDGELGLAPTWSQGFSIPVAEQQLISACLAAHTNKYGIQVGISVRGYYANGSYIAVSNAEQTAYPNDEGCYFGNLFDGTGVFSAYAGNSPLLDPYASSPRACALENGQPGSCAPMVATGRSCEQLCSGDPPDMNRYSEYRTCTWKGINFRPISVRLKSSDIY